MIRKANLESKPDSFEEHVYLNAQNIPVQLTAAPTTAGKQLPNHGDTGFFGGKAYKNYFGTVYRFDSMVAV